MTFRYATSLSCLRSAATVGRSRRFCSPACRQAAYVEPPNGCGKAQLPGHRSRLEGIIYQYLECETRYLAEQRCPDCARPCQRLDPGGICRCCQEMITIQELTEETGALTLARARHVHPSLNKPPQFEGKLSDADRYRDAVAFVTACAGSSSVPCSRLSRPHRPVLTATP